MFAAMCEGIREEAWGELGVDWTETEVGLSGEESVTSRLLVITLVLSKYFLKLQHFEQNFTDFL